MKYYKWLVHVYTTFSPKWLLHRHDPRCRIGCDRKCMAGKYYTPYCITVFFNGEKLSFTLSKFDRCCDVPYVLDCTPNSSWLPVLPHCCFVFIFQLKFTAGVHCEVVRILTLHSANVTMAVMGIKYTSHIDFKFTFCQQFTKWDFITSGHLKFWWCIMCFLKFVSWANIKFAFWASS